MRISRQTPYETQNKLKSEIRTVSFNGKEGDFLKIHGFAIPSHRCVNRVPMCTIFMQNIYSTISFGFRAEDNANATLLYQKSGFETSSFRKRRNSVEVSFSESSHSHF